MGFFNKKNEEHFLDFVVGQKENELKVKQLAIERCKDLIARMVAKSEFKVYTKENVAKKVSYRLNIRPNPNEDATSFFYKLVCKLIEKGEVLIVPISKEGQMVDDLFIADSFNTTDTILYAKTYKDIIISDLKGTTMKLEKNISADDAIYLSLGDSKISKIINDYFKEYNNLIETANNKYKKENFLKYLLAKPGEMVGIKDQDTGKEITYEQYKEKVLKGLFDNKNTVIMLSEQFKLTRLGGEREFKSDDLRNLLTDAKETVAQAFNIPLDLFNGKITEKSNAINDFITFAVLPIVEIIEDGFNAKLLREEDYIKGDRIKINKLKFKHYDVFDIATDIDKLMSNGFTLNQIFGILDIEKDTTDKLADTRRYTKNYATSDEILKGGEG